MNLFQLVFKQMRQRALSTWLTLLSVFPWRRPGDLHPDSSAAKARQTFCTCRAILGTSWIIGPPRVRRMQLVLNTVYYLDQSPGNIPYQLYEDMSRTSPPPPGRPDYRPYVRIAVPFMVGDSYRGRWIVGTSPQMFALR